ncbi:MAG: hypothetical protein LQ338_000911 [Usnochroma carphineum]|nr:MAG: hypothetical protein LQ338_000911 [Usnochroma carphineum]
MPSLLELPRELRDAIWREVCNKCNFYHPRLAYDQLQTSKQIRQELAPYLYETVVFRLHRPNQALHWIYTIGSFNSSCVRRLVLKFSSIGAERPYDDASDIWSSSLTSSLPNLEILTYEYDPSKIYKQHATNPIEDHPALFPRFDQVLSLNPKTRHGSSRHDHKDGILSSYSKLRDRPITHAVLAIDDTIPEILVLAFRSFLQINANIPLEQNITGLPTGFLADHNLHPCRTYLFIEDPQRPSVTLTYRKARPISGASAAKIPPPNLPVMLSVLPRLLYLRLGCPSTNSDFLSYLPTSLQTLDVAFRDPDPERVAANLHTLHRRCEQLFTLAIAVSPLHDNNDLPEGGRQIKEGTPQSEEEDLKSEWKPFWKALRDIQATGVRVCEGEGPGFKRAKKRLNS